MVTIVNFRAGCILWHWPAFYQKRECFKVLLSDRYSSRNKPSGECFR